MQLMTVYGGRKRLTPRMLKHLFVLTLIAVLLLGIFKMQLMTKYGGLKRLTPRMLKHLYVLTLIAVLLLGIFKMQLMTKYGGLKRLTPRMLKHLFVLTLIAVLLLRINWRMMYAQEKDTCDLLPKITIKHTVISKNDTCEAKFCSTREGNMRKIKSYNFTKAEPYLQYLIPKKNLKRIWTNRNISNIELPVIVTGASSNHYKEALKLLHNLKTVVFPVYKTDLVFFDLGLNQAQRKKIESLCSCKVVDFPFDKLPDHVRYLHGYCWKPIAMQLMLKDYEFVMWIDTSCRFKPSNLDPLFIKAKQNGLLSRYDDSRQNPLVARMHEDTFLFLKEPPCLYRNYFDWQGGLILVHSGVKFVYEYIIQTWVKCALVEECMKTTQKNNDALLHCRSNTVYHACHRYDQATLGLFLYRLFADSYDDFHLDKKEYYDFSREP